MSLRVLNVALLYLAINKTKADHVRQETDMRSLRQAVPQVIPQTMQQAVSRAVQQVTSTI